MDPLHQVITALQDGNFDKLKLILSQSHSIQKMFESRLLDPRVPRDHSPLVAVILKGDFSTFKYIIDNFQVNLEQETSAIIEGGYPVEGATPSGLLPLWGE